MRLIRVRTALLWMATVRLSVSFALGADGPTLVDGPSPIKANQRVLIAMLDGLGTDYVAQSEMPVFKGMMAKGFSKTVRAVMPTVTNVNNASICCGAWPEEHGITGNSFFDEATGQPEYMESCGTISGCRRCSSGRRVRREVRASDREKEDDRAAFARDRACRRRGRTIGRRRPTVRPCAADLQS